VVRGMVKQGHGGAIVNIGSMWAHQAIGATPSSGYSVGKGGRHALTHNLAIELAPTISGSIRSLRPSLPRRYTRSSSPRTSSTRPCTALTLPPARPGRHRPRPGQHHHLPALPGHQLGHRRHLERRRRRHSRTQLTTRHAVRRPNHRVQGLPQSTAGPENALP
jgi:hypothetical protein